VDPLLEQFRTYLESEGKSRRTIGTYMVAIRQLEAFMAPLGRDWREITPLDCQAWVAEVARRASPSWRNQCVSAGKALFGWLEEYLWDGEHRSPMAKMKTARVKANPKDPLPDERLAAVIAACKAEPDRFFRRRDEALFRLLLDSGIRRAECAAIRLSDLDIALGRVTPSPSATSLSGPTHHERPHVAIHRKSAFSSGRTGPLTSPILPGQRHFFA
jgi:site-specific recombinase XerD